MITRYLNRFMQRWMLSLSGEMFREAKWLRENNKPTEAIMMACLAHALNRATGDIK